MSKVDTYARIEGDERRMPAATPNGCSAYDLHDKLHVYRRNGVQEYIVWTIYPRRIEWFRLEEGPTFRWPWRTMA